MCPDLITLKTKNRKHIEGISILDSLGLKSSVFFD